MDDDRSVIAGSGMYNRQHGRIIGTKENNDKREEAETAKQIRRLTLS